jgi:hypothetical protein
LDAAALNPQPLPPKSIVQYSAPVISYARFPSASLFAW